MTRRLKLTVHVLSQKDLLIHFHGTVATATTKTQPLPPPATVATEITTTSTSRTTETAKIVNANAKRVTKRKLE